MSQVTTDQIQSKIGGIEVLLGEIDDIATKLRHPEEGDLFDAELHSIAFDLGMRLSNLYNQAWAANQAMRRAVEEASDELAEIHACRKIAAGWRG